VGPLGGDVLAGEGELGHVPGTDDAREALQAPEVRNDGHLGLAHREDRVGRGEADITRADQVDPAADAVACTAAMTGFGQEATALTDSWRRSTSSRVRVARDAFESGAPPPLRVLPWP